MSRACLYCGQPIPPVADGRGRRKIYCSSQCSGKFYWAKFSDEERQSKVAERWQRYRAKLAQETDEQRDLRRKRDNEKSRRWREKNPEAFRLADRASYARMKADPERYAKAQKKDKERSPNRRAAKYGLSVDKMNDLLAAGCYAPMCSEKREKFLHIDHDHSCCSGQTSCGKCVRGAMCIPHNILLGKLEKDPLFAIWVLYNPAFMLKEVRANEQANRSGAGSAI